MGFFPPSKEDVVLAIVAVSSPRGATLDEIQGHEMWHRYGSRWTSPKAEEVLEALQRLSRRRWVRERSSRRWQTRTC
ncbi:hypothetical protein [Micromonospora chalcea]|uniref:hypothetical protein n=1 Tax=Micromonospora chalcea TaxID=1874 RepID=UPI003D736B68